VVDVWSLVVPWVVDDDEFTSVEVWLVETLLETDWSPLEFTLTPGLILAPTLRSVLLMPTLASTPTFGFTLSVGFIENVPVESAVFDEADGVAVVDDCVPEVLCAVEADELRSVDDWLVETLLETDWPPLEFTLTPGLTFAPTLRSLLLMFTFAPTPTFGFTLVVLVLEADGALVVLADGCALDVEPEVDGVALVLLPFTVLALGAPGCVAGCDEDDGEAIDEELVEPEAVEPEAVEPEVVEPEPVEPEAVLSGMQSMWTGLEERSFAIPVSLSASLPALGWFSSLHRGFEAVLPLAAVVPVAADFDFALSAFSVVADLASAEPVALLLLEVWAKAGAAPSSAAMARVLR
jgi:hypothetical protein